MKDNKVIYHVYGRTEYAQPLTFIKAAAGRKEEPPAMPEGENWVEVIAFPETAVIQVIPRQKEKFE